MSTSKYPKDIHSFTTLDANMQPTNLDMIYRELWNSKWLILISIVIFSIGAAIFSLLRPNMYSSDILLAPTESTGQNGLSQMARQFNSLSNFAGLNIGNKEVSQTDLAVKIMTSRKFISDFINRNDLLVEVIAVKNWDQDTNSLMIDDDIYDASTEKWKRDTKPSFQEAYEIFVKKILNINKDKDSGLYNLSIEYYSPYVAKEWASLIVIEINQVMRERTLKESKQNLKYLSTQLSNTSISEMQTALYRLIEEQTKSLMLAEVQEEFVFKVIDPPIVPEVKSGPKRELITILGSILGLIFAFGAVFIRFIIKKSKYIEPE
jgi:LPS O-antigen subunit length determinant protein (WzzB/FepE family)